MFSGEFDYTVCSTDEEHYNRVNCCLASPITKFCSLTVTALTANCNIVVLNKDDYIMINGKQYFADEDYTNLGISGYGDVMNKLFEENSHIDFQFTLDRANRYQITSRNKFYIDRATYNVTLLLGLYNKEFPIYSDFRETEYGKIYFVQAESVGFSLSTPILYLTSNVGLQSYRNDIKQDTNMKGTKIVMRLNNSFSSDMPIIINNADFTTTILSNDLSNLEFTLVDGFMKEVKLLSPMFLAIHVSAIKDEEFVSDAYLSITNGKQK